MASIYPQPKMQFFASNGDPGVGYKLYTYVPGTSFSTPKTTYSDAVGTPNANPIIMDSRGEASVFWDGMYDVKLTTDLDVLVWTQAGVGLEGVTIVDGGVTTTIFDAIELRGVQFPSVEALRLSVSNHGRVSTAAFVEGTGIGFAQWYWDGTSGGTPTTALTLLTDLAAGYIINAGGYKYKFDPDQIFTPQMFSAVGNGVADDYAAMKALAACITVLGGGEVLFPKGTYLLNQFVTIGNGIVDPLVFSNCNGLSINGYGAKIDIKGNYNRDAVTTRSLSGLVCYNCKNLRIAGFEIDGNLDLTTTSSTFTEPNSYGVQLLSCIRVSLADLYLHHNMADGLNIRDDGIQLNPRVASKYVTGVNVVSQYNGRQGASFIQLRWATFIDSEFSYTGRTTINFSPSAGVDIEPNRSTATASPNQMDVNTGEITLINGHYTENNGSQFVATETTGVEGVRLIGGKVIVGGGSQAGVDTFILQVPRGVCEDVEFDLGTTASKLCYFGLSSSTTATVAVERCRFTLNKTGQKIVDTQSKKSVFRDNEIRVVDTVPHVGTQQYISSSNTNAEWRTNKVFVPKEVYSDGGTGDRHIVLSFAPKVSEGNSFDTDLLAAAGDTGTAHFANSYGATTIARNDLYTGTAPGTVDTFRPVFNGAFDTRLPYNKSIPGSGSVTYDPPSLADGAGTTTTVTVTGAALGDLVVVSFSRDLQGITLTGWVSAADTVSVRFQNESGGVLDLASGTLRAQVTKV